MAIEAARLMVKVGADTAEAETRLQKFSSGLSNYGNQLTSMGTRMTAFLTVPLVMAGRQAVNSATQYSEAMNILGAVTQATGFEMQQMDALAQALGRDLTLPATSASDAAEAMVELSKAGLTTSQTMASVRGVLQLSAAGNISNARAAEVASNALNVFNLNAAETTRVADLLAAAANASSAEIEDVADSLQMSGAVYSAAGMSIEELTALISEMANAGIKGSDAGTSLKQMLLSLQSPSDKATALMRQYGIEIYDAQGAMLPMRDIINTFSTQLGGLSEEARNAALATIFGSDAVRAANIVLMGGVEAYDEMTQAVTREGAASDLAEARMQGFSGVVERMKSAVETAALALGQAAEGPVTRLAETITNAANAFSELPKGMQETIVSLGLIAIVAGPVITVLGQIATGIGGLMGIGAVAGGVQALGAAFSLMAGASTVGGALSVASLGLAGVAAVALPAAVAIAAVAIAWNKFITQTNKAGQLATQSAWGDFFSQQIASGNSATAVLAEYQAAQARVEQQLADAGALRIFIAHQDQLKSDTEGLNVALAAASTSYAEYRGVVAQAAEPISVFTQAEWEAARAAEGIVSATAAVDMTGLTEGADAGALSLEQMSQVAQTTYGDLQGLIDQAETLREKMGEWVSGTASETASILGQYLPESSQRYQTALGGLDEIMGTNYLTQYNLTQSIKDLVAEYSRTGDLDAFKDGLTKIKEDGLADMKGQLEDVTKRAQDLYDKLLHLPKEIQIDIGFNVEDLPDWIMQAQGSTMGGGRVGVGMYNQRATGGPGWAGQLYQVNERQKVEYFVPSVSGRITPIAPAGAQMQRGDVNVYANVQSEMDWYTVGATLRSQMLRGEL